jgi:hypothetical protein
MFDNVKKNIRFKMLRKLVHLLIYKRRHCDDKNSLKIISNVESINYYDRDNYHNLA